MKLRTLRVLAPIAMVGMLVAADGDANPTLVDCTPDGAVEHFLEQGGPSETFDIMASPIPYPGQDGGPDGTPMWDASLVSFTVAMNHDVDALAGAGTMTFDWDSPADAGSDIDIYVFDAAGTLVTSSTGDNTTGPAGESIFLDFEPCETYRVDIQNWAAVNAPTITVVAEAGARYPRVR